MQQVSLKIKEGITLNVEAKSNKMKRKLLLNGNTLNAVDLIRYAVSFQGISSNISSIQLKRQDLKNKAHDSLATRQSGHFLSMYNTLFSTKGESAKPMSDDFHFGIEIECLIPRGTKPEFDEDGDETGHEIPREDCEVFDYLHEYFQELKIKGLRIKHDGSLTDNDEFCGVEFVLIQNSKDAEFSQLKKLCSGLNNLGAKIDSSCGLHIHLDSRDGNGESRANKLEKCLPILNLMVPQGRLNNQYCRNDRSKRGGRYAKINTESLSKHNTVEVRLHSGTTDFRKISNWMRILFSISEFNSRFMKTPCFENIHYVIEKLNWSIETTAYYFERVAKFTGQKCPLTSNEANQQAIDAA